MSRGERENETGQAFARVFVVGYDVDPRAYSTFCQHHLIDFLGDKPAFHTFFLLSKGSSADRPAPTDRLFGKWPREFTRPADLRDTLLDSVLDGIRQPRRPRTAIVVVANNPSDLKRFTLLFERLRKELERRKQISTLIWTVGVSLSGPGYEDESIPELISGSRPAFHNIFVLGQSTKSPGSLSARHYHNLRIVIDIARDTESAWPALKALEPNIPCARVTWFDHHNQAIQLQSGGLLGYLRQAMESLTESREETQQETSFREKIDKQLESISPDSNENPGTPPIPLNKLEVGPGTQTESLHFLHKYVEYFNGFAISEHDRLATDVRNFVERRDNDRLKYLEQIQETIRDLALPAGGFSLRSINFVQGEIGRITKLKEEWEAEAGNQRRSFIQDHQQLQDRPDPHGLGHLAFPVLAEAMQFGSSVKNADTAASHLPTSRRSLVILSLAPLFLIGFAGASHFLSVDRAIRTPSEDLWPLAATGLFVLCTPAALVILSSLRHRQTQRERFAHLRVLSDRIIDFIKSAMDGARKYSVTTRCALLGGEFARMLSTRIEQEPRQALLEQQADFFVSIRPQPMDQTERAQIHEIAATAPPAKWAREFIRIKVGSFSGDGSWLLQLGHEGSIDGIDVDMGALRDQPIPVPTRWAAESNRVLLVPLVLHRGSEKLEGEDKEQKLEQ